jgi:pimeloyl-ACP methyl ester carboxylesterase
MTPVSSGRSALSLVMLLLACSLACNEDPSSAVENRPAPLPGLTPGEHEWTTQDGNTMPYVVAGKNDADVTVVFVHCWMCNRTFWDAQLPALAEHYRTVTPDLPGHGEAGSQRAEWTIDAYGGDIAGLIDELGLSRVVKVGHSMGGPVSLRTSARLPGKALGVVALDTLHYAEFELDGEGLEGFMKAFEDDFVGGG